MKHDGTDPACGESGASAQPLRVGVQRHVVATADDVVAERGEEGREEGE